jgi:hypothetical protein
MLRKCRVGITTAAAITFTSDKKDQNEWLTRKLGQRNMNKNAN